MRIKIAPPQALQETGLRQNQEDALWPPFGQATQDDRLFLVCDGMGGHEHGEVASQTVAEAIGRFLAARTDPEQPLTDSLLADAVAEAYNQLDRHDHPGDHRKMGTTLTLLCLHRGGAIMAHIGDSRIYHLRPGREPSPALYVSRDHSLVMDLFLSGELSWEEMGTYEGKNIITRAMQPHQERRFKPDIVHTTDIRPGDVFLLCSDGVLEQLSDSQLYAILTADATDRQRAQRLREATKAAADNHSAYIVSIASVDREEQDDTAPHNEDTSRANLMVIARQQQEEEQAAAPRADNSTRWSLKKLFSRWH